MSPSDQTASAAGSRSLSRTRRPQPESGWVSRQVAALAAAWERGEPASAAEVLERYPDLDTEAAIRLIYEEACLRREAGLKVDTAEVVRRYPQWGEELQALFDCDRLLRPSGVFALYPQVGEPLGPFLLLAELGRGASGRTYLATEPTLADRPVVVKVIPDDQDEHLALARLRHTHIVPLFSEHSFPERGLRGLCMPYLGGTSLAQILKELADIPLGQRSGKLLVEVIDRNTRALPTPPPADGPFRRSLEQASYVQAMLWIAACLADALHYAHAHGLVHMDLKPSNVLITVDGQPMLLDFHLARRPIRPGELVTDRLGGTPGWMSPEQAAALETVSGGRPVPAAVDGRSDLFALGLLLREALTAPGSAWDERGRRATSRRPAGVSVGLADMVRKCLAPDPRDRYDDAAALAEDLRRQLHDLPLRGVRNRSPYERWQKWRRRHPGALAWGITGLSIVLAAAIALTASVAAYRQRVRQLRIALEDGRNYRASGQYHEAIHILKRGLESAGTLPAVGELRRALDEELHLAQRGQMAEELHELADLIRFRYGIDLPSPEDAQSLVRLCRTLWERRERIIPAAGRLLPSTVEQQIKTDLLELVAVWADLRLRLAPAGEAEEARREVLQLLNEAEASLGPSLTLDSRRARLRVTPRPATLLGAEDCGPRSAWEHYDLGRFYLRSGRIEAAAAEFRRTLALRPQDFWSNFYQGLCSYRLRQFDEAVAAFRTCIALVPQAAICHYDRALAYEALGRTDEAYQDYTRAITLDPHLAAARLNRGILSAKSGHHREAIADFEQALQAHPDRETLGRLYYNLALAQLARGDRPSALAHAERAVRLGCQEAKSLRDEGR
ncbi:MAG: tetratricopeptide repeat protein [Isosphaeraceae bacterium]|nr:tetratricopeptide repeat protein [Isosphaeraceae bacterium]